MKSEYILKWNNFFRKIGKQNPNRVSKFGMPEYTLFSLYAVIVGASVGLATVFFHKSIEWCTEFFYGYTAEHLLYLGAGIVAIFPIIGMLIQALMIILFPVTAKKRGVPEVIKAVAMRGGFIRFRTTLFHFIAPIINIGSGGTVGPEGPAAQLGGGVASKLGQLLGLSDSRRRMFTAAGAGAAISAVFNTPLGGIFFALEVILLNDFQTATFSALILSSVTASAISRIFLGDSPAFQFELVKFAHYEYLYLYALLGLVAGFLSVAYLKYENISENFIKQKLRAKLPQWVVMALVGAIVGAAGLFYSEILGIGYEAINEILASNLALDVVLILMILKFLLVPIILNSGGFGGVFAPTLFIGACFGFLFSSFVSYVWGIEVNSTIFVLVGMGAVLGGINSIPISAILIIFEMTKDYSFILPLMLAVVLSTTIVQLFLKKSVHEEHLEKQGFSITNSRQTSILKSIKVSEILRNDALLIPEETTLGDLISQLLNSHHGTFYTVNKNGQLTGVISETELRPIITEYEQLRDMLVAKDIASDKLTTVSDTDHLDYVMNLFGNINIDELPVISSKEPGKIIGTVWRQDVISTYNRETLKNNLTDNLAHQISSIKNAHSSRVASGYSITEVRVKEDFIGKSLAELKLRNTAGLEILMVKQKSSPFADKNDENIIVPDSQYVIEPDDVLVLFGADADIEKTKNW